MTPATAPPSWSTKRVRVVAPSMVLNASSWTSVTTSTSAAGMANIPDGQLDAVIESAEECPGECIFIEE
jgi:ferredoxin